MPPRRWQMPPPTSVQPHTRLPLARGLAGFWGFRNGGGQVFPNYPGIPDLGLSQNGSVVWTPSRGGNAVKSDGSTGYFQTGDIRATISQTPLTIWAYMDVQWKNIVGGIGGWRIGVNFYMLRLFTNTIECSNTMGGGNASCNFSPSGLNAAAGPHTMAMSYDGTTTRSYWDGIPQASSTGTSGFYTFGGGSFSMDILSDGSNLLTEPLMAFGIWRRVLVPAELQMLARDPWALYRNPSPRVTYAAAGGGGSTFTQSMSGSVTPSGLLIKRTGKLYLGTNTPAGALTRQTGKLLLGSEAASGVLIRQARKTLTGSETPAGTISNTKVALKTVTGSETPTGALTRQTGKQLAGSETASGTLTRRVGKLLTGSETAVGVLIKQARKLLTGSESATGSLSNTFVPGGGSTFTKSLAGSLTPSGVLLKLPIKLVVGAVTPAGTLQRRIGKLFSGSESATGVLIKQVTHLLVGSETPAGTVASAKVALLAISGSVGSAGSLIRRANKVVQGAITSSGSLAARTSKVLAGSASPSGSLGKRLSTLMTGSTSPAGTLSLRDIVSGAIAPTIVRVLKARATIFTMLRRS
jgi:hypothetical protein